MSTLSLAKNGYVSSPTRTKHNKAKYLYIFHYHNSGELDLQYCPTDEMWADGLTKPLQGSKFLLFWAFLMNCPENYTEDPPFPIQPISSNIPMKPQLHKTKPSPGECVRAQPSGTKVSSLDCELIPVQPKPMQKGVSWHNSLSPSRLSPATPSCRLLPVWIQATAE